MRAFAHLSDVNKRVVFQNTGEKLNMHPSIIEKDYWVCYVLDYLFHRSKWNNSLVFKGGTSLSKAYHLINRFSEDIDLIIDWRMINYETDEPWLERSKTQQDKFNKKMINATSNYLRKEFMPSVNDDLQREIGSGIKLYVDKTDPDGCTVNVLYPKLFENNYLRPEIRLEIGPIAEWTPSSEQPIRPFAAEQYPNVFGNPETRIRTVDAERTFWEKITILHKVANAGKVPQRRYARHYYDVYKLGNSIVKERALKRVDLLKQDVLFKNKFYYSKSASYETAIPGTIKLIPQDSILSAIEEDYERMKDMIYGDIPEFKTILSYLKTLEIEINSIR